MPPADGLNSVELAEYAATGFLCMPARFIEQLSALRVAVAALLEPQVLGRQCRANPRLDFDDPGTLLKMVEPCLDISPGLATFASSAGVQSIFRSLFGGATPVLFEDKVHMKLPTSDVAQSYAGTGAFPTHQDHVFWSAYSRNLTTLVIYLDDATEANGALQLYPHPPSHGLLPHTPAHNFPLELTRAALAATKAAAPATAVLPAGSAVLFGCMTPHASLPNISTSPRRSLFLSYNPIGDGDGYNTLSCVQPMYPLGSHNLGHLPRHKIEAWEAWRQAGEPDRWQAGGAALIWGDAGLQKQNTPSHGMEQSNLELRGQVDDPHGEAFCDTSAYAPCCVQLWRSPSVSTVKPGQAPWLLPVGGGDEPLAQLFLPDQGGWPRSFHFKNVPEGEYAVLAFIDTRGNGRLNLPGDSNDEWRPQPRGWYSSTGVGEIDAEVRVIRLSHTDAAKGKAEVPSVRIVLRQPAVIHRL